MRKEYWPVYLGMVLCLLMAVSGCTQIEAAGDALFGAPEPTNTQVISAFNQQMSDLRKEVEATGNQEMIAKFNEWERKIVGPTTQMLDNPADYIAKTLGGTTGLLFVTAGLFWRKWRASQKVAEQTILGIDAAYPAGLPDELKSALKAFQDAEVKKNVAIVKAGA